jgi:hypothetical protein
VPHGMPIIGFIAYPCSREPNGSADRSIKTLYAAII